MTENLVYHPFIEEHSTVGWDKQTVRYMLKNKAKLKKAAKAYVMRYNSSLGNILADEVFQETLCYLQRSSDFDIELSVNPETKKVITLEGYVMNKMHHIAKQMACRKTEERQNIVSDSIKNRSGEVVSLFDTIPIYSSADTAYSKETAINELEEVIESRKGLRHRFQIDFYATLYLKLAMDKYLENIVTKQELLEIFLEINGVSPSDCNKYAANKADSDVLEVIDHLYRVDIDTGLGILSRYVPGYKRILHIVKKLRNKTELVSA